MPCPVCDLDMGISLQVRTDDGDDFKDFEGVASADWSSDGTVTIKYDDKDDVEVEGEIFSAETDEEKMKVFIKPDTDGVPIEQYEEITLVMQLPGYIQLHQEPERFPNSTYKPRTRGTIIDVQPQN